MRKRSGFLADTAELKKLIAEHPDYPICVLASEDANTGDYGWTVCSKIIFSVGEILDCEQPVDDCRMFDDRDDFEEKLEEWLWDEFSSDYSEYTEEEFQKALKEEKSKYEPYWKDCIFIYADN